MVGCSEHSYKPDSHGDAMKIPYWLISLVFIAGFACSASSARGVTFSNFWTIGLNAFYTAPDKIGFGGSIAIWYTRYHGAIAGSVSNSKRYIILVPFFSSLRGDL